MRFAERRIHKNRLLFLLLLLTQQSLQDETTNRSQVFDSNGTRASKSTTAATATTEDATEAQCTVQQFTDDAQQPMLPLLLLHPQLLHLAF
ncbi:hypothetical protein ACLKA6_006571 [Drosophila palustris]